MRISLLVLATLAALGTPAVAQDRTPPAGSHRAFTQPGDTRSVAPVAPTYEGRSVTGEAAASDNRRVRD